MSTAGGSFGNKSGPQSTARDAPAAAPKPIGRLSFIDLAGSERGADTTDNDRQVCHPPGRNNLHDFSMK
jgi:hypothetical protein